MKSSEAKDMRKQIKNVAQAMAPTILASEAGTVMYRQLMQAVQGRLNDIELQIKETLTKIDERSLDLQAYAMRQISAMIPMPTPQEGVKNEESNTEPTDNRNQ